MNETVKNILERRSIRGYKPDPVPGELVKLIVDCGQFAATGMGIQPWHFTVVENRAMLDKIAEANKQIALAQGGPMAERIKTMPKFDNFHGAPMAIILSADKSNAGAVADCANATENMCIAAQSLGLGTCYLASFKMAMLEPEGAYLLGELGIPDGYVPTFAISLGYPDFTPDERVPRKAGAVNYVR